MEEEVGIKVTRLRRRLSVEADDVKSPSTQSTPTKKRGGRLAAKPQLELIDENATGTEKPKRTRKSAARDEPEEKAVTPSRRSTRIRSNTSIVSETPAEPEDKGTPSRRSTRIKSNTSLVAETVQFTDSPRAKRAARRTSQVGSDNEAPITPARQTRRTRKDSTSSVDKQAESTTKLGTQVKEVIVEEAETIDKSAINKTTPTKERTDSPTVRKSPRLFDKTSRKNSEQDGDEKENESKNVQKANKDEKSDVVDSVTVTPSIKVDASFETTEQNNLSVATANLIKELASEPKKGNFDLNRTTSESEVPRGKSKRQRTKSWTTISSSPSNDKEILSDTEAIKNKRNNFKLANISGSGDNMSNIDNKNAQENQKQDTSKRSLNLSTTSSLSKSTTLDTSINGTSIKHTSSKLDRSITKEKESSISISKTDFDSSQKYDSNFTEKFFRAAPSGTVQSLVYIEDSDSNADSTEKVNVNKELDTEDQCVPVVEHNLEDNSKDPKSDLSYEPMDIDETMPENVSLSAFTDKENLGKRQSILNISQVNNVSIDKNAKSQIKSAVFDLDNDNETTIDKLQMNSVINETGDDTKNKSMNKSKRISAIDNIDVDNDNNNDRSKNQTSIIDDINKSVNKSKRKSSISNHTVNVDIDINSSTIDNKETNALGRKTSILNIDPSNDIDNDSSIRDLMNTSSKKSKRKSSIKKINGDDNLDNKSTNTETDNDGVSNMNLEKSKRKSSITNTDNNDSVIKDTDKSNIKSTNSELMDNDEVDSSKRKSFSENINDDITNKTANKSKSKVSISNSLSDDHADKSLPMSKRKSAITDVDNDKNINKSTNKSKRKSSMSQSLDKSSDENKSTLVLSQLKDISETNVPKDSSELNESHDANVQLSKSVNAPNINKDNDKNNLSLTYSTSTPLQEKSIKKVGMQINTSIIAPNSVTKTEKKGNLNRSKKEVSVLSQNDEESEPSDEEDEEESNEEEEEDSEGENQSTNKSKMVDDEAEEASDDYESGDSRSDDEREYEEQNEIVEKGETLDSEEEDFSDDSNYEKGSFVVDSDEEDDDLLSGSDDDLSMSANELCMSAKSKKKFNERKIKEQKKASREMFESRHKLNESDKSTKSDKPKFKKSNRQRLESSDEDSDEGDFVAQPKKHRRPRIDSSQDLSLPQSDVDVSISKKKKKAKRLSESTCEKSIMNEKEITIHENSDTEKADPLCLQNIIKEEPITPQKSLNISTVAITNIETVEEVQVTKEVSVIKFNQTVDPLQTTVSHDFDATDDDSDESISENEEITQNYESILKDLNKKSNKVNSLDISLNLNKKVKEKTNEPIVDQLNLTQLKKKSKKKKPRDISESDENKSIFKKEEKNNKSLSIQDEGSSDSIDMKLLFNEDSNDSDTKVISSQDNADNEVVKDFIPLKRTEAKTNILDNTDATGSAKNASILNESKTKKKQKSFHSVENINEQANDQLGFFVDTTGTHANLNKSDTNTSMIDTKKKINVSLTYVEETNDNDDSNDGPLEVSYYRDKFNTSNQGTKTTETSNVNTIAESLSQSGKKKKKNKSLNSSQINLADTEKDIAEKFINTSVLSTAGSSKKKKKSTESIEQTSEKEIETEAIHNVLVDSGKKQQKKNVLDNPVVENIVEEDTNVANEKDRKNKRKRKPSANSSVEGVKEGVTLLDTSKSLNMSLLNTNKKKKRKISNNDEVIDPETQSAFEVPEIQPVITEVDKQSGKKHKNKNKLTQIEIQPVITEVDNQSGKKHKNKNKPTQIDDKAADDKNDGTTKKNKKRKERDDDDSEKLPKIIKQNFFDKFQIPRLPANIVTQLDDKPKKEIDTATKAISTTSFKVEETKKRRNKPSQYLEQSVYLNDSVEETSKKLKIKKPKVLPFIPTASTSDHGFTTNFRINVIPQDTQFVAQSSDMSNFKKDCLQKNRIKKLGTFEMYKRHRNIKISKF